MYFLYSCIFGLGLGGEIKFQLSYKMGKNKNRKFKKVIKYLYPNGEEYEGSGITFYFIELVFFLGYIIFSPIHFFNSDFVGSRKVYWEEMNRNGKN